MSMVEREARMSRLRHMPLFFIGGAMKSGTTWLQMLLDSHPRLGCGGEGHFMDRLSPGLDEALLAYNRYVHGKNSIFREIGGYGIFSAEDCGYLLSQAILLLMDKTSGKPGALAIGEKTPNNVEYYDLLHRLFPQARFVTIIRDGRDAAVSAWFHNRRTSPDWFSGKFPTLMQYVDYFAYYWGDYVRRGEEFRSAHPDLCHCLRYEDLLARPADTLAALLAFLGVDNGAATVDACLEATSFLRLSQGRERGQEDTASFFRKGVSGDWRNHFDPPMLDLFRSQAHGWLEKMGYN